MIRFGMGGRELNRIVYKSHGTKFTSVGPPTGKQPTKKRTDKHEGSVLLTLTSTLKQKLSH